MFRLEFLGPVKAVVDDGKASGSTALELGTVSMTENHIRGGLVHLA